jgi:hypothetical protein
VPLIYSLLFPARAVALYLSARHKAHQKNQEDSDDTHSV